MTTPTATAMNRVAAPTVIAETPLEATRKPPTGLEAAVLTDSEVDAEAEAEAEGVAAALAVMLALAEAEGDAEAESEVRGDDDGVAMGTAIVALPAATPALAWSCAHSTMATGGGA